MMLRAKLAATATALTAATALTLGVAGTGNALMPQAGGDPQPPAKEVKAEPPKPAANTDDGRQLQERLVLQRWFSRPTLQRFSFPSLGVTLLRPAVPLPPPRRPRDDRCLMPRPPIEQVDQYSAHLGNTGLSIVDAHPPHRVSLLNCTRHLDADARDDARALSGG